MKAHRKSVIEPHWEREVVFRVSLQRRIPTARRITDSSADLLFLLQEHPFRELPLLR